VQPRAEDRLDTPLHPDQSALVVLQIQNESLPGESARPDDHVEVAVRERNMTDRNLFHRLAAQRVEDEVVARHQHPFEHPAIEQEAPLVLANVNPMQRKHHDLLF
jgi:hypothetical protein